MKTAEDFHREAEVKPEGMNQTIIDTTSVPVSYFEIGNTYQYYNHKFSIWARGKWKTEMHKDKGARTVFEVTFDGKTDEKMYMDSTGIKKRIGDPRSNRNGGGGSVNDEKKATSTKRVPKTANEKAAQIQTKYADTIKAVREKVGKLQDDDRILSALNLLCTMIESVATERIENVTNAEKAKRAERLERIARWTSVLPKMQADAVQAMQDGNFDRAIDLGKAVKEMQAELLLLQAEENAYLASIASAESVSD